nr:phage tail sheath subtilisin-like domain-containing protein [Chloroflexota bacterium]
MPSYLSPGVYTREIDFSHYVKQISTSACGIMGIAERGPINKATLVTSWDQFIRKFGSYTADGYLAYAARAFFDNGGQVLYVNRVVHMIDPAIRFMVTAMKAQTMVPDRRGAFATLTTGTSPTNRITWRAKTAGTTGNTITVALVKSGNNTPLSVSVAGQAITVNLATDSSGNQISTCAQVVSAVNGNASASALVVATAVDSGIVAPVAATALSGGIDTASSLIVMAASEGKWANNITVEASDGTASPTMGFNLIVRYKGEIVEVFRDLSMDPVSTSYAELVVNEHSEYISVDDMNLGGVDPATRRPLVGTHYLTMGSDGLTGMCDADYIGSSSGRTGLYAFDEIEDINIMLVPGVSTAPVITAGVAYAEARKDLLYIAETPVYLEPTDAVNFRKGQGFYTHAAFNSSYAALYYPWLEITDPLTNTKKLIPPTGTVAGCIARSDEKTGVWYAPAGIDRGRIFNVLSLSRNTSRGERDVLYSAGINVIASFPDTGINIWGQKTLQSQSSATDRINVRRLMMYVEEAISQSSRFVVFEPNNSQTWRALVRLVSPFLQNIKSKGGFYDFRVQCDDETNTPQMIDTNQMVCRVFVKPTKTAEIVGSCIWARR